MMLDVDFAELRQGFINYLPVGGLIGIIFLVELVLVVSTWAAPGVLEVVVAVPGPAVVAGQAGMVQVQALPVATNTEAIGRVLYTNYGLFFELAGLILLVAMIGAIVLTLRERVGVKRQDISVQNARDPKEVVSLRNVPSRQGLPEEVS